MGQVTLELTDGTQLLFRVDDSRDGVIVDFGKGAKQDDFAGTWSPVERDALFVDPPTTDRAVLESGKRYLLIAKHLAALTDYLTDVGDAIWDRVWGAKEETLFAGFSDEIPKDGT